MSIQKFLKTNKYLLLILLLGLFLRLYRYTSESIWLDETISIFLANQNILFIINFIDPTPPLFYILLHCWTIFGNSPQILKLLTILISTINIVAIYLVAKKLYSKKIGIYAALFVAVSPINVYYAQELRAYSLLFLVSTFLIYYYLCFDNSLKSKFLYFIFFIATVYTHIYGLFIIFAIYLHKFIIKRKDYFYFSKWFKFNLILGLLSLPWFYRIYQMVLLDEAGWIQTPLPKELFFVFFQSISGYSIFIFGIILFIVGSILAIYSLIKQLKKSKISIEFLWILIPVFVPFILSFCLKPFFFPRYALLINIPIYILIAYSLKDNKFFKKIIFIFVFLSILVVILQSHSTLKDPWKQIDVKPPVGIIAFYEAFPYIYLNEPDCFKEKSIDAVYVCAAEREIFAVQSDYPLDPKKKYNLILSKEWLTEQDSYIAQKYIGDNSTKVAYHMNNDVWIFKNMRKTNPIHVIYKN
ncbi:MAG: glycosyltransferase family 39 protein [Nanoarchaeota archaeon]